MKGSVLIHTSISDSLSINRWEGDGVLVAQGMKELDILSILKLAILVERTLVGVILRQHIKACSGVMIPILQECSFGLLLVGTREKAHKEEGGTTVCFDKAKHGSIYRQVHNHTRDKYSMHKVG